MALSKWTSYQGTDLYRWDGSTAYTYTTQHMEIDADGAANAYHPNDTGLDALANAGYPNGGWRSVLVTDPNDATTPFVQTSGPFAGYFLSMTTLKDKNLPSTDASKYVDATAVPYIVFPGDFFQMAGTGAMGDVAMVRNLSNGLESCAIVADVGPSTAALGEISMKLVENLGGSSPNPRTGAGMPGGDIQYVIFPRSKANPPWPQSLSDLDQIARSELAKLGGWPP